MTTRRANTKKEHRLSIRLPDADIAIIDRATGCGVNRERTSSGMPPYAWPKTSSWKAC